MRPVILFASSFALAAAAGCGGSGYLGSESSTTSANRARQGGSSYDFAAESAEGEMVASRASAGGAPGTPYPTPSSAPMGPAMTREEGGGYDAVADRDEAGPPMIAQATPPRAPRPDVPAHQSHQTTDGSSGPLLLYEAYLTLAVYQVDENQRAVASLGTELGGYLARQDDTTIVIRVPATKFREAVGRIEALGDVLHRAIQATDVSEEFRDVQIRLRNAEQVRDRLASLLDQARTVEDSLRIERELERLTGEIESMKGRIRFLEDRIAFSTITVSFSPREEENLQGQLFHLPFDWLYNLGLRTLLNLR